MSKLLSCGWFTVRKNKLLLLICIVMFVAAALSAFSNAAMLRGAYESGADDVTMVMPDAPQSEPVPVSDRPLPPFRNVALTTTPGLGIVFAFFVSMFLNEEYSSGGVRDRIIGGFSRTSLYFSNFLTAFFGCGLITACSLLGDLTALSVSVLADLSAAEYVATVGLLFLLTAVFCAIYTLVGMLVCGRGTSSGVACLIVSCVIYIVLLMAYAQIYSMLNEPEFFQDYSIDAAGNMIVGPSLPNPNYLSGPIRDTYMTVFEIMPVSQSTLLIGFAPEHPLYLAGYSAILIVVCSLIGNGVFKHRDII